MQRPPIVLRDSPATQRLFEMLVASAERVGFTLLPDGSIEYPPIPMSPTHPVRADRRRKVAT